MVYNKKGVFLPLFVIFTAVILSMLLFTMYGTESKKNDLIGLRAISLVKAYDEGSKIEFYLDLSTDYSNKNALNILADNAGYSEKSRCEKLSQTLIDNEEYVLLNTCPVLNLNQEYEEQLKIEIKEYINLYESSYRKIDFNKLGLEITQQQFQDIPQDVADPYNYIYTKTVRESNVLTLEDLNNKIKVTFSDMVLPVESSEQSSITIKPVTSLKQPNFSVYERLYAVLHKDCSRKQASECSNALKLEFTEATIVQENELLKVKIPTSEGNIKFAINPKQIPPQYQL